MNQLTPKDPDPPKVAADTWYTGSDSSIEGFKDSKKLEAKKTQWAQNHLMLIRKNLQKVGNP